MQRWNTLWCMCSWLLSRPSTRMCKFWFSQLYPLLSECSDCHWLSGVCSWLLRSLWRLQSMCRVWVVFSSIFMSKCLFAWSYSIQLCLFGAFCDIWEMDDAGRIVLYIVSNDLNASILANLVINSTWKRDNTINRIIYKVVDLSNCVTNNHNRAFYNLLIIYTNELLALPQLLLKITSPSFTLKPTQTHLHYKWITHKITNPPFCLNLKRQSLIIS